MARRWFASGGLTLLGLALGMEIFAEDAPKANTEATIKAKNEAILRKLEKPIPLRVKDLPLGAVFDYVKKATTEPGDTGVPIDVDHDGPRESPGHAHDAGHLRVEGRPVPEGFPDISCSAE